MYLERSVKNETHTFTVMLNTIILYSSFHNKLKTTYLNGKVNKRIDFLLDVLLRVERDNFFKYMEKEILHPINYKVVQEEDRHCRGLKINADHVKVIHILIIVHIKFIHLYTSYFIIIGAWQWKVGS